MASEERLRIESIASGSEAGNM